MANIKFNIQADLEKVVRLREEVVRLKAELAKTDGKGMSNVVTQLNSVQHELDATIKKTAQHEAAYATMSKGVTSATGAMVNSLKANLKGAEKEVDDFTRKILEQKALIKDIEKDVADRKRTVNNAYGMAKSPALSEYNAAVKALNEEKAALAGLTTKQGEARIKVRELKREYKDYTEQLKKGSSASSMFAKGLAMLGGVYAVKRLGNEIISATGQIQMLNVSFQTLLQSKQKADAVMQEIIQTAITTPFQLTELASGAKQLIAYGFAAEEVNGTLIRLGNVASALGLPLERLTYLYGTTRTQGRLYARDMLQFTNSGIPMLQGLADMYGKSTEQINKMVSAGKIGFPEVQKVIEQMTNKGGKFYNLMQEQAKTIPGQLSNLQDSFAMMFNEIGQGQTGLISGTVSLTKTLVDNYEKVGRVILTLIATYGIYSAAVFIAAAANGTLLASNNKLVLGYVAVTKAIRGMTVALMSNPVAAAAAVVTILIGTLWALSDSTNAAERAQKSLSETMEKAKRVKDDYTSDADALVRKVRGETTTLYDQVTAWNELISRFEYFKKLAESTSLEEFREMTEKQVAEIMSSFTNGVSEGFIESEYKAKKDELDRMQAELDDKVKKQSKSKTVRRAREIVDLREDIKQATIEVAGLKKEVDKFDDNKKEADFLKLPKDERKEYYQREYDNLLREREALEAINPEWLNDTQVKRLAALDTLIVNSKNKLESYKSDSLVRDQEHWDKQKKNAEEALKAIDSTSLKILQKASPTALKSGKVEGVDSMIVESYTKNKGLLDEAIAELEGYSFNKSAKQGEKEQKEREEARKRLDKKLKEDRLNAEMEYQSSVLAVQMNSYDKQLNELTLELEKQNREVEKKRDEALEILAKSKKKDVKDLTTEERKEVDTVYDEQIVQNKQVYNKKKEKLDKESADTISKIWKEATESRLSDNDKELQAINDKYDELIRRAKEAGATLEQLNDINVEREKSRTIAKIEQALEMVDFEEQIQSKLAETTKSFFDQQNAIKRKQIQISIDSANKRIELLKLQEGEGKNNAQEIQKWLNVVAISKQEMAKLKDNYFVVAEALGNALSQSSDRFVAKIGAMLASVGTQLGNIQQASIKGDTFGKVSGIVSLAIAVGNYLKEIRLWNEGKAIEAQRKVTEQVARRVQFENEINRVIAERQAMESEGIFTGRDNEKILTDNLALITKQSDALNKALGDLYGNAIFSADGEASRRLFGTKKGTYEFSLMDVLKGMMPKDNITKDMIGGTFFKSLFSGNILDALGSLLDPAGLFGGYADQKAKLDAFNNLSSAVKEALAAMGKSVSDFATMSNEDMLTFFDLMEKSGHITDEATKKLLATAKEQLEAAKEAEEKIKEVIKSLAGSIGDDLKNSLIKNFKEGFGYGEQAGAKAADSLRKSMNKVLEEMLANRIFQAAFSGLFDNLEAEMKDSFGAGGDMTWIDDFSRFISQIPEATDMFNKGMDEAKKKGQEYGFNFFNNDTQQETGGGFQAMRQETGEELSGRFSSLQMAMIESNQSNKLMLGEVKAMREAVSGIDFERYHDESMRMVDEMRATSAQAVRHLAKIEKHTEVLPEMGENIKKVVENTKYIAG